MTWVGLQFDLALNTYDKTISVEGAMRHRPASWILRGRDVRNLANYITRARKNPKRDSLIWPPKTSARIVGVRVGAWVGDVVGYRGEGAGGGCGLAGADISPSASTPRREYQRGRRNRAYREAGAI